MNLFFFTYLIISHTNFFGFLLLLSGINGIIVGSVVQFCLFHRLDILSSNGFESFRRSTVATPVWCGASVCLPADSGWYQVSLCFLRCLNSQIMASWEECFSVAACIWSYMAAQLNLTGLQPSLPLFHPVAEWLVKTPPERCL